MDALVVGFVVVQALVLGAAAGLAISRGRLIGRIRELLAEDPDANRRLASSDMGDGIDPEVAVRRLVDRASAAERRTTQVTRDRSLLLDMIGVGIIRLTDESVVETANIPAHQFLGRPAGSLIGRTAVEAFIDPVIETIAESARETGAAAGEVTLRYEDGPTLLVRARRSPVSGTWLIMEDVSELRRLQRIRAEFIDNLSHELRTPLSTVSLLAETLVGEAELAGEGIPSRMRDRITKIQVETDHLVQMVEELLDLSRIESGGPILLLDSVDLGRLAVASVERLRLFAERQGVSLVVDAPPDLPRVRGAEERLAQVLVNLVHNAVKFSPDGGEVAARVRSVGREVEVAVEDHGIGIPKADQARIFERFYKADKARRRGAGTGLGLAIARHVIESHDGRIWVESEEGQGSTFTFSVPTGEPEPV